MAPDETTPTISTATDHADARFEASRKFLELCSLPIYRLPAEILVNVLTFVPIDTYPSLIPATWHLLRHKGIVSPIPTDRLQAILIWPRTGFFDSLANASTPPPTRRAYIDKSMRKPLLSRLAPRPQFFWEGFTDVKARLRGGFERLPREVKDTVLEMLEPEGKVNVVLAAFRFADEQIEWMTGEKVV